MNGASRSAEATGDIARRLRSRAPPKEPSAEEKVQRSGQLGRLELHIGLADRWIEQLNIDRWGSHLTMRDIEAYVYRTSEIPWTSRGSAARSSIPSWRCRMSVGLRRNFGFPVVVPLIPAFLISVESDVS